MLWIDSTIWHIIDILPWIDSILRYTGAVGVAGSSPRSRGATKAPQSLPDTSVLETIIRPRETWPRLCSPPKCPKYESHLPSPRPLLFTSLSRFLQQPPCWRTGSSCSWIILLRRGWRMARKTPFKAPWRFGCSSSRRWRVAKPEYNRSRHTGRGAPHICTQARRGPDKSREDSHQSKSTAVHEHRHCAQGVHLGAVGVSTSRIWTLGKLKMDVT